MMNIKTRFLESLDHAQPHRPDRIDQHINIVTLHQERRVADPRDANLPRLHSWEKRSCVLRARTSCEKRWDPDAGDEITFRPIAARTQFNALRFFGAGELCVANDFALSRKRIRHRPKTI